MIEIAANGPGYTLGKACRIAFSALVGAVDHALDNRQYVMCGQYWIGLFAHIGPIQRIKQDGPQPMRDALRILIKGQSRLLYIEQSGQGRPMKLVTHSGTDHAG